MNGTFWMQNLLTVAAKARIFSMVGLDTRFLGAQLDVASTEAPVSLENSRALTGFKRKIDLNIVERASKIDLQGHEWKKFWHRLFK